MLKHTAYITKKKELSFQPAICYLSFRWVMREYMVKNPKRVPAISFSSISSSALHAISLAFLIQIS